jgi:hypothetical protein
MDGGEGQLYPGHSPAVPLDGMLGGSQSRSGRCQKQESLLLREVKPRTPVTIVNVLLGGGQCIFYTSNTKVT